MSSPSEEVIEFAADAAAAVVVGGFLSSDGLAAVADAVERRPELCVVVVGPIDPSLEVLVALASGVRGYLAESSEERWVADAVDAVLAGEPVVPKEVLRSLLQPLFSGGRGLKVSRSEGREVELTGKEWEVLVLLRQGRTTADIAARLVVSRATVRTHGAALVRKLGVSSRNALRSPGDRPGNPGAPFRRVGSSGLTRGRLTRLASGTTLTWSREGAMAWNLSGSYVETCSCELMCPCNLSFDHGATYDFCRVTLVFTVREGQIGGTDIGGLTVAVIADTPKVMTEGNWRLGVFIDDRASDEQFDKLLRVFTGQLGGPMAALAPLVGEVIGAERAAIEVLNDGVHHTVRIGDVIDFEIVDIVPFGVETGQPVRFDGMFHPVGSNLTMAEAKRSRINAFGIQYEGKTGLSTSSFSWAA
jgi:DNA-binding NarL/FixJ family response regulator